MKILIYGNRKQDDEYYDISTPGKELAAYLKVFKTLDEDWDVYSADDLSDGHQKLYDAAKGGDGESAKRLINLRHTYEYEEVRQGVVIDPLT